MADPEHVAVVKEEAAAIAEWRQANRGKRLDLSDANLTLANLTLADLSSADLTDANLTLANLTDANLTLANLTLANLTDANLTDADLSGANLFGANLSDATLSGATLVDADLAGANLSLADLSGANLTGANLTLADLFSANLTSANLIGAHLSKAMVGATAVGDCDLRGCKGLETVEHRYPSSIGVDTLVKTWRGAGNRWTPELLTFFTGAGVPRELLDAIPGILAEVKYQSAFISYGGPDAEFARQLHGDLTGRGVQCWIYELNATPGEKTWPEIRRSLLAADKVIVLCSAKSLVRAGVRKELEEVIDKTEDKLMPVSLDETWKEEGFEVRRDGRDLKRYLTERNYADFSGPKAYDTQLELLLRALKRPGG